MRIAIRFLLAGVLGALVSFQTTSASRPDAATFQVDPVHSTVHFRINHLGVAAFYGRFNQVTGSFTVEEGGSGSVEITIDAGSVDTGSAKRDGHLKGPDFFSARQFPTITFQSNALKHTGAKSYTATGMLTLHGVSKEITVELERLGTRNAMGGLRSGFEGTFTIKRSEFGMTWGLDQKLLGDEVKLIIAVEGISK